MGMYRRSPASPARIGRASGKEKADSRWNTRLRIYCNRNAANLSVMDGTGGCEHYSSLGISVRCSSRHKGLEGHQGSIRFTVGAGFIRHAPAPKGRAGTPVLLDKKKRHPASRMAFVVLFRRASVRCSLGCLGGSSGVDSHPVERPVDEGYGHRKEAQCQDVGQGGTLFVGE
jgi:hypothetical protein